MLGIIISFIIGLIFGMALMACFAANRAAGDMPKPEGMEGKQDGR